MVSLFQKWRKVECNFTKVVISDFFCIVKLRSEDDRVLSFTSGHPRVRSMNVTDTESRPVLVPADNKSKPSVTRKLESKSTRNAKVTAEKKAPSPSPPPPPVRATSRLRRQEQLLRMNLSLNASCSSDASTDSFQSRASTGRIPRKIPANRKKQFVPKVDKVVPDSILGSPVGGFLSKSRCAWVTPNTDPCYAVFHDEEWGVPVHDDKKLFELLMLSGALAELTWPAILGKRHIFREVFADFDPSLVCKLNEKKILAPESPAGSLLSEPKLRAIIDNAHLVMKIIEEFGSFDKYCWNFVNNKPILNKFRYSREVPVKTPKAEVLSKDMVRRGFRSVSPTVIYSFMQAAGLTNDHLVSCYRYNECNSKFEEMIEEEMKPILEEKKLNEVGTLGLLKSVEALNIS